LSVIFDYSGKESFKIKKRHDLCSFWNALKGRDE